MHAFDGSSLSSPSFSCPLCLHLKTSVLNSSGCSGKGEFPLQSFVLSLRSCSPSFSASLRMGSSPVTWESGGGWIFLAFFRKSTVSQCSNFSRSVFIMGKHKACNMGGLATAPGGLRASLACVVGPMSSLPAAQMSWWAEHLWPSAFALLRVSHLFRRKSSSTVHSSIAQGNTERRLGLDLQLREISSSSPHSCSRTSWNADPLAKGGLSIPASGSTAMPESASILWPQLTTQNPAESSTSEVNQCLATRAEQLGWGRGGQPCSRKQLSLTLLCSRELSQSLKHWGRWEGLIPAWSLATLGTPGPTASLGAQGRARSVCVHREVGAEC